MSLTHIYTINWHSATVLEILLTVHRQNIRADSSTPSKQVGSEPSSMKTVLWLNLTYNNRKFHVREVLQLQNQQRKFYGLNDIFSLFQNFRE
jgi:hypothetical protein